MPGSGLGLFQRAASCVSTCRATRASRAEWLSVGFGVSGVGFQVSGFAFGYPGVSMCRVSGSYFQFAGVRMSLLRFGLSPSSGIGHRHLRGTACRLEGLRSVGFLVSVVPVTGVAVGCWMSRVGVRLSFRIWGFQLRFLQRRVSDVTSCRVLGSGCRILVFCLFRHSAIPCFVALGRVHDVRLRTSAVGFLWIC